MLHLKSFMDGNDVHYLFKSSKEKLKELAGRYDLVLKSKIKNIQKDQVAGLMEIGVPSEDSKSENRNRERKDESGY